MKPQFFVLLLIVGIVLSGCNRSTELTVKANDKLSSSENVNTDKSPDGSKPRLDQTTNIAEFKSKYPVVFIGFASLENRQVTTSGWSLVNNDIIDAEEALIEKLSKHDKTLFKVDIMNCAGYLGSGMLQYDSGRGIYWKVEQMFAETIPTDAPEKIRQCTGENNTQNDSSPSGNVFAVESQGDKRQNIKIGKVDTRQIFASLPKNIRRWLNDKSNFVNESSSREKNNLSAGDNWTDIDGDAEIDLVEVSAYIGEFENSKIFYLIKGKWVEIGSVQPA